MLEHERLSDLRAVAENAYGVYEAPRTHLTTQKPKGTPKMTEIACPSCKRGHAAPRSQSGKTVRCDDCGHEFVARNGQPQSISVGCPNCKRIHTAPPSARGKQARCNDCGHRFVVPAAPSSRRPSNGERPVMPPPVPQTDQTHSEPAGDVLASYRRTSKHSGNGTWQRMKRGMTVVWARTRAVRLKRNVKSLETAIERELEVLGTLLLQHRPSEVEIGSETTELSRLQGELAQKETALQTLRTTKGSRSALKELIREIDQLRRRQRELMIEIGKKADAVRPEMPGAIGHYNGIDHLRTSVAAKQGQLAALESTAGPVLTRDTIRPRLLVKPLAALGGIIAAIVVACLLWPSASLPCWAREGVPNDADGVAYVNLEKLRGSPLYETYGDKIFLGVQDLKSSLDLNDVLEYFAVSLRSGEVLMVRTREDLSLEELLPDLDADAERIDYRGMEYVRLDRNVHRFVAKADECVFCLAASEDALTDVLYGFSREGSPDLNDQRWSVLRPVLEQDAYVASLCDGRATSFGRDLILVQPGESRAFAVGVSVDSSKATMGGAIEFRRERDAGRYVEDFNDNPIELGRNGRFRLESYLARTATSMEADQRGKLVQFAATWEIEELEHILHHLMDL